MKEIENQLAMANNELEAFVYQTPHDLHSSYVSFIALLDYVEPGLSKDKTHALKSLQVIKRFLSDLENLVIGYFTIDSGQTRKRRYD